MNEVLAALEEALTDESRATAYLAAQLLAALGRSPTVLSSETLRTRLIDIFSDTLRHPDVGREVYLLNRWDFIVSKGTLAQALYRVLAQVVALPE